MDTDHRQLLSLLNDLMKPISTVKSNLNGVFCKKKMKLLRKKKIN